MLSSSAGMSEIQTGNHGETHRPWTPGVRPPPDAAPGALPRPRKGKVSVIGDAAGEKKCVVRRSTGLDYSSRTESLLAYKTTRHLVQLKLGPLVPLVPVSGAACWTEPVRSPSHVDRAGHLIDLLARTTLPGSGSAQYGDHFAENGRVIAGDGFVRRIVRHQPHPAASRRSRLTVASPPNWRPRCRRSRHRAGASP